MTQIFAEAEYLGSIPNKKTTEQEVVVPSASAQVLPPFEAAHAAATPSPANYTATATTTATPIYWNENDNNYNTQNIPTTTSNPTPNVTVATTVHPASQSAQVERRLARMKHHRKARQAMAATTGVVAGLIVFGPIGAVIGGITLHTITKSAGRARERHVRQAHYGKNHTHIRRRRTMRRYSFA
eukprot:CAMPEP_0116832984 /NCGR_PEP_ID=MMETSP0418-20121206/6190_1 /TAXON_ID=1158023 /ORGANISM="Astrosyne radiata, Strain 13vi08-1A" /LENGTH=183 /DNA_ID=CAMNT_0004462395 /DNA_START=29 /DNA_END=580 /DNA_ORIENTATION=-